LSGIPSLTPENNTHYNRTSTSFIGLSGTA
jgi:hypothetical protein